MTNRRIKIALWAALAANLAAASMRAQSYRADVLTTTGSVSGTANAINSQGVAVGGVLVGTGSAPVEYDDGMTSLFDVPFGWMDVYPQVIDSAGDAFGAAYANANDNLVQFDDGGASIVATAPAAVLFVDGVNASGTVVGGIESGAQGSATDAFFYSRGTFTDLGALSGDASDMLSSVNSSGVAVGTGYTSASTAHAIGGTVAGVYDLGWGAGSQATSINDSGTIVGQTTVGSAQVGVISVAGVVSGISSPNWSAINPAAINNAGAVVGTAMLNIGGTQEERPFLYQNGTVTDLNALVSIPGVTLQKATAITDKGKILAIAQDGESYYTLTPVSLHFAVSAPASAPLGSPVTVTVTALDELNSPAPYYDGTVHLTSTDGAAVLPANEGLNAGVRAFQVTFSTQGTQTVTAADVQNPSITGTSGPVVASLGPRISTQPASQVVNPGASPTFSVSASGQPAPTYQWTFDGADIPGATSPSYTVSGAQASNSGAYAVVVSNSDGAVLSTAALLTVTATSGGPSIAEQPSSYAIFSGQTVILTVGAPASGSSAASLRPSVAGGQTYKWYLNGSLLSDGAGISGSQSAALILSGPAAVPGGYECLIENANGSVLSQTAQLSLSSAAYPSRLINVSCRAQVGQGADILIAGFVVGGAGGGSLPVLVRGSGPALSAFSVPGVLPDPNLELFSTSPMPALVASNTAWGGGTALTAAAASVGAFAWSDPSSNDTALLENLAPGPYTANISGKSGDGGVALAEVYDASPEANITVSSPRLINLSARILVGTGANSLIAGFVVGGETAKTLLIRASGPALAKYGVTGTLPDPELQLNGSGGVIATSIGWQGDAQIAAEAAQVGAFPWGDAATPDSALLLTLPPGSYTANVSGASGDSGVGLVEVYEVQ